MTKRLVLAVAILGLVAFIAPPAVAGEEEGGEGKIKFHFMSRVRYENLNNYWDFEDHDNALGNDRLAFWPYRNMFGFKAKLADNVWAAMDVQNVGSFGNQSPMLSTGHPIFQHEDWDGFPAAGASGRDTYLYRAVIGMSEIGGTGFGVAVGRDEMNIGNGLIIGNEPFYSGIVFDGLKAWYKAETWKVMGFYSVTAERNDPGTLFNWYTGWWDGGYEDQTLWGFVGSTWFGDEIKQNVDAYVMQARDGWSNYWWNGVANPTLNTYGAHWWRDVETKEQADALGLSWNLEIAFQGGDTGMDWDPNVEVDFGGSIMEAEVGWTFAPDSIMHGPFIGMHVASGDDDETDDEWAGWTPLFPSYHGRLGAADFFSGWGWHYEGGITAYNIGYWVKAGDGKHKAYIKYWMFEPTESDIDDGMGGYEIEDYGTEIDLGYSYKYSENLHLFATIAQLSPDDGLADPWGVGGQPDDAVTRLYGGFYLKFH